MSHFAASLRSSRKGNGRAPQKKRNRSQKDGLGDAAGSTELRSLLAKHNKKLRTSQASAAYTPLKHSIRTLRRWERQSGKKYYSLNALDREQAHAEMDAMEGAAGQQKVKKSVATSDKQRRVARNVRGNTSATNSAKHSGKLPTTEHATSLSFEFDTPVALYYNLWDSAGALQHTTEGTLNAWFKNEHELLARSSDASAATSQRQKGKKVSATKASEGGRRAVSLDEQLRRKLVAHNNKLREQQRRRRQEGKTKTG